MPTNYLIRDTVNRLRVLNSGDMSSADLRRQIFRLAGMAIWHELEKGKTVSIPHVGKFSHRWEWLHGVALIASVEVGGAPGVAVPHFHSFKGFRKYVRRLFRTPPPVVPAGPSVDKEVWR